MCVCVFALKRNILSYFPTLSFFSNRFHELPLNYNQSHIVIIIVSPKLNLSQLVLGSTIVFCVIYDYSKDIHEKPKNKERTGFNVFFFKYTCNYLQI